jgi:hypothetical protein
LETYKLNNEDREALMMFMQAYARQTVEFRKAARAPGEGATTEAEGLLFAQLGALPSDTARVILLKSEALEVKAEYDRQLFREWNKFTKANKDANYQDFLVSEEKDALDNAYDGRLKTMRERNADLFRTAPKTAPASGSKPPAAKSQKASDNKPQPGAKQPPTIKGDDDPVFINLQPGDLYIAPDGTVRTKR